MISYEEALARIYSCCYPMTKKRLGLEKVNGYVLASDTAARVDYPPFDQSAVDGFGINLTGIDNAVHRQKDSFAVVRTVFAGDVPGAPVEIGQAVKIMTGASVPEGVDTVVMKEFCQEDAGGVIVKKALEPGANIRKRAEEFCAGGRVLTEGTRITPPVVGLLATLGHVSLEVFDKPVVSVVLTGNELVAPGTELGEGQIYDSNSYMLTAALSGMGIDQYRVSRVRDNREDIKQSLATAMDESDVLLTVGGISVGDRDVIRDVLSELGVEKQFWKVAIKPGKPIYFGRYANDAFQGFTGSNSSLVFGLPGNPVAALLGFNQFVRPALQRMMGEKNDSSFTVPARLTVEMRKKPEREQWVRGLLNVVGGQLIVSPTQGQQSHMLGGLAQANCLIILPAGQSVFQEGDDVLVKHLKWDR
jgi:molybdopterin molybdotransferase